ncbi:cytochrome b-c1 complex subunit 2, mitochondrial-like [Ylistrum balloti]|uniref:cytochrome b-c1 complex subunit 2, mitochondrial-like n=1 Tax=Ylistrum balloti TaxID=509963 RepID=UPI002905A67A|nr:cytochrome b-c1 complex subunit 2, mitochondrial-like [Ylistrum balloti]
MGFFAPTERNKPVNDRRRPPYYDPTLGHGRLFSSVQAAEQVSTQDATKFEKEPPKVTKLDNQLTVASIENASLISRVGIAVKAGARFEHAGYNGITHFFRNALAVTTATTHCVSVVRELQKYGCNLSCTSNREYIFYQVEGTRDTIERGVDMMTTVLSEPLYYKHEIAGVANLVNLDVQSLSPEAMVMEDLHATAFTGGMANSIYCPQHQISNINADMMHAYRLSLFKEPRMAFVGLGVNSDFLVERAKQYPASLGLLGTPKEIPSKYVGGESRVQTGGDLAYAFLVTEGPSMTSKDAAAAAVLQYVMGMGSVVKYSPGIVSRLGKAVNTAVGNDNFAVSAVNLPYSDTGLFGFSVTGNASDIGTIVKAAAAEFASVTKAGAISDEAVNNAKNRLKSALHMEYDDTANLINSMAVESLTTGNVTEVAALSQIVDSVSTADVVNVAKKTINGKPTLASRGNLSWMPRLVDLM